MPPIVKQHRTKKNKACMCKFFHIYRKVVWFGCVRWTVLPEMFKRSDSQSALFIGNGDDDAAVLLVGGYGGTGREAWLLSGRPQINHDGQWRWLQLSPMQEKRHDQPAMLLLGRERALVCGGFYGTRTAKMLQLPRNDNEKGVWTLLIQPMTPSGAEHSLSTSTTAL